MNGDQAKKQALRNHRKRIIRDTTTLTSEMKKNTDPEPKKDPQVIKGEKPDLGEILMSWQAFKFWIFFKILGSI